jgi:hypothetical protein
MQHVYVGGGMSLTTEGALRQVGPSLLMLILAFLFVLYSVGMNPGEIVELATRLFPQLPVAKAFEIVYC